MTKFRFVHISDAHLAVVPGRKNFKELFDNPRALTFRNFKQGKVSILPASFDRDILESATRFIYERYSTIDAVVFTGDLATTGLAADILVAKNFIQSRSNKFVENDLSVLGFAINKLSLMPGNHDRFKDVTGTPGSNYFDLAFSDQWKAEYPGVQSNIFQKEGHRLVFISADFCLASGLHASPGIYPYYVGQGKAYRAVIEKLKAETESLIFKFTNPTIVWKIHFPAISCSDLFKLVDHAEVHKAADQYQIPIVLSGHLHKVSSDLVGQATNLLCAGSMCSAEDTENCYIHILELDVEEQKLISFHRTNYHYDDTQNEFVQIASRVTYAFN